MHHLAFPKAFTHEHPPVRNVNALVEDKMTFGQRASDWVARIAGSWPFIIAQSVLLTIWVIINIVMVVRQWDPYPFILLNLLLSLQAAYATPIIMMSQNRQALRDRLEAHHDFEINQKTEIEVRAVLEHLAAQDQALAEIYAILKAQTAKGDGAGT